jgi:hypothetical protein
MKQWRIDAARRCLVAAHALSLVAASGARETAALVAGSFSREGLGTRRRLSAMKSRPANPRRDPVDPTARHAGLFREFRRPRCRDQIADERGYDLSSLFDVEAGHPVAVMMLVET